MDLVCPFPDILASVSPIPADMPGLLGSNHGLLLNIGTSQYGTNEEMTLLWTPSLGWKRFSDGAGAPLPVRYGPMRSVASYVCTRLSIFEVPGLTEESLVLWLRSALEDLESMAMAVSVMES